MNISATVLLAFGMSMDAFAASIGKGATLHKPKFSEALRTGLIFGAIETLTPLIGWGLGMLASQFVLEWNHWIAFVLLVFLIYLPLTILIPSSSGLATLSIPIMAPLGKFAGVGGDEIICRFVNGKGVLRLAAVRDLAHPGQRERFTA